MFTFRVSDMTCGHCVRSITEAVAGLDPEAKVDIDLGSHLVAVQSGAAASEVSRVIQEAGYNPVVVDDASCGSTSAPPSKRGCCCS